MEDLTSKVDDCDQEDNVKRVLFANDNWEDAVSEAVWFGQKIP